MRFLIQFFYLRFCHHPVEGQTLHVHLFFQKGLTFLKYKEGEIFLEASVAYSLKLIIFSLFTSTFITFNRFETSLLSSQSFQKRSWKNIIN